jgi:phospholipid/cholesterol/gamma-HCH transport system ATP-binding protein
MPVEILVLKDVVKTFGERRVLDGVSLTVGEGEHLSLIGESTSGKSVLFKVIVGLIRPDDGEVLVFGQDMARIGENEKRRVLKDVEMQFQSGALFDSMTVKENLGFVLDEAGGKSRPEKEKIIEDLLRGVNLWAAANKYPYELSGGMQKRAAVARALCTFPRLALFDEPAAGLDPVTSVRIIQMLGSLLAEHHMTVLAATTSVHLAKKFSDRFVLLQEGRVHADGLWSDLLAQGDDYTRKFLSRDLAV